MSENEYEKGFVLTEAGEYDCSDLHSWGPGMRQCYVIHYIARGSGFLVSGQKTYRIETGQSFLIRPYTVVSYYPDRDDPWKYMWINFEDKSSHNVQPLTGFEPGSCIRDDVPSSKVQPVFLRLVSLDIFRSNKAEAQGLFQSLLGIYSDTLSSKQEMHREEIRDSRIDEAMRIIRASCHRYWFNVGSLCEQMHINRVTLYRLFVSCLNVSPSQYLTHYRISQAKIMLGKGASVKDTAYSCGFEDPLYFARAFKAMTGLSPSAYRKLGQRGCGHFLGP